MRANILQIIGGRTAARQPNPVGLARYGPGGASITERASVTEQ